MHALVNVVVEHEYVANIIVKFGIMLDPRNPLFLIFFDIRGSITILSLVVARTNGDLKKKYEIFFTKEALSIIANI